MLFRRYPNRVGLPLNWTKRKETLAKNKPTRVAKKLAKKAPLLEDMLIEEAEQETVDIEKVRQQRQDNIDNTIRRKRQFEARTWIKARKRFFECDKETQEKIIKKWESNRYMPKTAIYFAGVVDRESGDQAKRVAEAKASFEEYKRKKAEKEASCGVQESLF